MADSLYIGVAGAQYAKHRIKRRSTYAQTMSSRIFLPFAIDVTTVVDFGCGTGSILSRLPCQNRLGIEINEPTAAEARTRGITILSTVADLPSECADLAISHHALEHVPNPRAVLLELHRSLKPGKKLVLVVPCEVALRRYFRSWSDAPDVHLYSWNPRSIGNLVRDCGFVVEKAKVLPAGYSHYTKWTDNIPVVGFVCHQAVAHSLGRFNTICIAHKESC